MVSSVESGGRWVGKRRRWGVVAPVLVWAWVCVGVAASAGAQVGPLAPRWLAGDPPPAVETFSAGLQRHGIGLDEGSLVAALANPDGEVRSLAAAQLATNDDHAVLPQMIRAIQDERDPQVQVNLAGAATWMESRRGLEQLQIICKDINVPSTARLDAARYVSNKLDATCFPAVRSIAHTDGDASVRAQAVVAAALYRGQAEGAQAVAVSALNDPDATVRITAADTLRRMQATGALGAVTSALAAEGDETTRAHLRQAARVLQAVSAKEGASPGPQR